MRRVAITGWVMALAVLTMTTTSCNRNQGPDPASANMAPADQSAPAPENAEPVESASYNQQTTQASEPPPELPDYSQPPCPGDNYLWTPGYWANSADGYYWVPGAWVTAPYIGALWTPPWWGYSDGRYLWHAGYWGPYVGFYGGINYGFGYTGLGFYGGYWRGGVFNYNRAVMNVNTSVVTNVYRYSVTNYTSGRVAYNGGRGGLNVRPTPSEQVALRQRRMQAVPAQIQQERAAAANRAQFASVNRGHPAIAAAESRTAERSNQLPAREPASGNPRPDERQRMPVANEGARREQAQHAAPPPVAAPQEPHRYGEAQREIERAPQAEPQPRAAVNRPEPAARPAPREVRSAPHPAPEPRAAQVEARPAPRPAQQSRPEQAMRPAQESRPPEAKPASHPAQEARPQPAVRPAPEAHAAPTKKDERKHL